MSDKYLDGWKKWLARGLVGALVLVAGYQVANRGRRDIGDYERDLYRGNEIEEEREEDYEMKGVTSGMKTGGMKVTRNRLEEKVEKEVESERSENNYNPPEDYDVSSEGLGLIKEFEGFRGEAYKCPAGVWTIGYGHTRDVKKGDTITKEEAENYLREDIRKFENYIDNNVEVGLTQSQFDSLVSFVYNIGPGAFENSTLLKKLNSREYDEAAEEFNRWIYSNGKELEGLKRRREKERELFESS